MIRLFTLTLTVAVAALPAFAQSAADAALVQKARAIHDRVITLDTHDDINPDNFTRAKNYTQRLNTQVNIPKMVEGGLDASFFIVYVGQGPLTPAGYDDAYKQAVAKFDAIHHLTKEIAPDKIELALTAADVPRIAKSGKKVALIGVENAYSLGTDIKPQLYDVSVDLGPGDVLVLYTDGVTEVRRRRREVFGHAELTALPSGCGGLPPDAIADRVERAVLAASEGRLRDDMAILALGPTPGGDAHMLSGRRATSTEDIDG